MSVCIAELLKVPTGDFYSNIVEGRLKAGGCGCSDFVNELWQGIAQSKFSRDIGERITRDFAGKRTTTLHPAVYFNNAALLGLGVKCPLYVTFTNYAETANGVNRYRTNMVILSVSHGLRRRHNDAIASMDAHGVKVFHVTNVGSYRCSHA